MSRRNKYYLESHELAVAINYAYCYKIWESELERIGDGMKGVSYDCQPKGGSQDNVLEEIAIRRAEISDRMALIESTCRMANEELYPWLLIGVTQEEASYNYLRNNLNPKIPCGHNLYYESRQKFHFLLYQRLMKLKER